MKRLFLMTALVVGSPGAANAEDGFAARNWQPVYDASGMFATYGTDTLDPGRVRIGATFDYANNPIVLATGGTPLSPVVTDASTFEIGACVGLPNRFSAGLVIPLTSHTYLNPVGVDRLRGVADGGVGDIRAAAKWTALEPKAFVPGLALAAEISFPSGDARSWLGSGNVQPALIVAAQENLGPVTLMANVGYRIRPRESDVWGTTVKDSFLYRGGVAWDTGFRGLTVVGELHGAADTTGGPIPTELGAGLRYPITEDIHVAAGANGGLTDTLGTPAYRAYATVGWELGKKPAPPVVATPTPAPTPIVVATPVPTPTPVTQPVPPTKVAGIKPPDPDPTPPEPADPVRIRIEQRIIEIPEMIHFKHNSAKIRRGSHPILDAVALVINKHPELLVIQIVGHTDSTGGGVFNQVLSMRRARSVRRYLESKGVEPARLRSAGRGESKPLESNKTPEGRLANRRVEFKILETVSDSETEPPGIP